MSVENRLQRAFSSWHKKPSFGEPAHRYFNRLVGEEGFASARSYARSIGIETRSLLSEDLVAAVMNLPLPEDAKLSLERWTVKRKGSFYHLAGQRLRVRQLELGRRRFCRGCLAEMQSHRAWWEIVSFRKCPFHGVELEDRYGAGSYIDWTWPHYGHAPNGESLATRLPDFEGLDTYEHYILKRLGCVDSQPRPLLDKMALYEVVDLCSTIGRLLANPWQIAAPDSDSFHQVGFRALAGSMEDLIDAHERWLIENAAEALSSGLDHGFGWCRRGGRGKQLLHSAWKLADRAQKQAFSRHARVTYLPGGEGLEFEYLTLRALTKEIGIDIRHLRTFLRKTGLAPTDMRFSDEDADRVRAAYGRLLSQKEVSFIVGCRPRMVGNLVRHGHLPFQTTNRGGEFLIDPNDAKALAAKLANLPTSGAPGKQVTPWTYAQKMGIAETAVVNSLMDGSLIPAAIDPKRVGFVACRLNIAPPAKVVRQHAKRGEMTLGHTARFLGLAQPHVSKLADAGILKIVRREVGMNRFVDADQAVAFGQRYVDAFWYRKEMRSGENHIREALAKLGVETHFDDILGSRGGPPGNIVERDRIHAALGLAPVAATLQAKWEQFRAIMDVDCPAFQLPGILPPSEVTFSNSTGLTRFVVVIVGQEIVVRKAFSPRALREWKWLLENKAEVYRTLSILNLRKKSGADVVEGSCVLDTVETMRALAKAMADYHWLLLKKKIR